MWNDRRNNFSKLLESPAFLVGSACGIAALVGLGWFLHASSQKDRSLEAVPFNWQSSPITPDHAPLAKNSMMIARQALPKGEAARSGGEDIVGEEAGARRSGAKEGASDDSAKDGAVPGEEGRTSWTDKLAEMFGYGKAEEKPKAQFGDLGGPNGAQFGSNGMNSSVSAPPAPAAPRPGASSAGLASGWPVDGRSTARASVDGRMPGRVYSRQTRETSAFAARGLSHFGSNVSVPGKATDVGTVALQTGYSQTPTGVSMPGVSAPSPGVSSGDDPGRNNGDNGVWPDPSGTISPPDPGNHGEPPAPVVPATPAEINKQADEHLKVANQYRTQVIVPLIQQEKTKIVPFKQGVIKAIQTLKPLDKYVQMQRSRFADMPMAQEALADIHELISGEGKTAQEGSVSGEFLRRLQESKRNIIDGVNLIGKIPANCVFPGLSKKVKVDYHTASANGHDALDQAIVQAVNVRDEALKAADVVAGESAALEASAPNAARAKAIRAVADHVENQLRVAGKSIPADLKKANKVRGKLKEKPLTALTKKARKLNEKIKEQCDAVQERYSAYPDNATRRDVLDDVNAAENSSGVAVNTLIVRDNHVVATNPLHGTVLAGDEASGTLVRLCESYQGLKVLSADAKKAHPAQQ
ncbi:MAG: hypothetical protein WCU88_03360 [Elusimicrobiota bacterium]|jgi:hypothetical protein